MTAQLLQAPTTNIAYAEVFPAEVQVNPKNQKYPNGITEHQDSETQTRFPIHPNIDVRPDPTIQVGPGVVVGPNVFVGDKPLPNPLLKDVLPQNHPLLTNP